MKVYFLALATLLVVCVGCAYDGQQILQKPTEYHAPPAEMLAHPGPMVGGPGPGVMAMMAAPPAIPAGPPRTTQVRVLGPAGMAIGWQIEGGFADNQLTAPDRYNFVQGYTYRLKFSGIPGREGTPLYPTLHVYPAHPTTDAYLSHNALPIRLTDEDLDQIETNNFVTKVIYLPDARYQELAIAGVEELVSTRLPPGVDPVSEADRRGTIMAVLRVGNMDLEMPEEMGGEIQQTGHVVQVDGEDEQFVPPMPVGAYDGSAAGVPGDLMMGGPGGPGQPPFDPILGATGAMMYGYPNTGTPIGLVGPPHIPLGKRAGLQNHRVVNETDVDLAPPVETFTIRSKHEPGISLPPPVREVEYTETHPVYHAGELSHPRWAAGAEPFPVPQP
ncbi:MAG: hypothetical protein DWQ34_19155 [Planctomycetota bacterium]|nr:MAG: hypothetical protein DWQ34_19155 [Planctomycetota bacterium]REJ97521.1 MAG: hypothetical protein DWQ29_00010 [Planctomycetota bacterium]REK24351.1 MAG: hypothetical protein DWQ41_15125 [Planctomycetota bacterium]